ncbi:MULTISPECIES: phage holin family protein [Enterobacter]|uniref:phage holin family protein n=1 Tax=Enterobacter TaxID=547 RepID=UPI000D67272B|nr:MULTISPECIES: phage holin family protein [Enterobacter]MCM7152194.1 phage holin family protein [Enterobacter kobei]PWI79549.1 phage holin family protein [Enterobacter sp. CGMCC 5087]RAY33795.1 phage holin family protein [Enterobacter kobei]HBB4750273.1 phage holin family protein [Enterobacter cloacae]
MTSPELLLILNAAICGGIAIRVLLFRREGSRHRWWGGWLAYLLIVVAASVPIRTFYGYYVSADWSEVIIKAVFLAALIKTKGNVVQIFKITRSQHGH